MKKSFLSFCFALFLLSFHIDVSAQQRQISGVVTNADGNGIPSATVQVTETKETTVTSEDGRFSIKIATGQHLEISSVGHVNNSIIVGKGNNLNISLVSCFFKG